MTYAFSRQRTIAADRLSAADLSLIGRHLPDAVEVHPARAMPTHPGRLEAAHLAMTDTNPNRADAPPAPLASAAAEPQPPAEERVRSVRLLNRVLARFTHRERKEFVLQVVQPSLVGMIDGTVSTLAPIFAAAVSSDSRTALLVGIATALGAGVSMGISEALSDTGQQTGRGSAAVRGTITGAATTLGGIFHSLPFIISNLHRALVVAGIVVAIELLAIAWVRHRFLQVSLRSSLIGVTLGGAVVLAIGVAIGSA
jgi:erythrin-vacuolar iron transport family protein